MYSDSIITTRKVRVVGAKTRTANKIFSYEGDTPGTFFGQHLWKGYGKRITITEGELDAASCLEIAPTWDVVSLPNGAAAAKKSIQRNLQWLQGYDEIVLFFDADEPGIQAATEAASILPPGKVKIARLNGYKDASEALQEGDRDALKRAYWDAKPFRPDGIVEGKNLLDIVTTPNPPNDHDYPFQGLQSKAARHTIWRACHNHCRIWYRKVQLLSGTCNFSTTNRRTGRLPGS